MKAQNKLRYILAIDSGATKSEAALYTYNDGKKGVKKTFRDKFINYNLLGFDESVKRLKGIIYRAEKYTGKRNLTIVSAGIAGARYEKDRKRLTAALKHATGINKIIISPDTEIALAAAFEPGETNCGILIAGTGSILYYRNNSGKLNRIGGWGRHIGDEGSGFWIAREALYKVTKHYDKRINAEKLAEIFRKEHGIHEGNIIKQVYHKGFDISKLAKHVFRCAESGDKTSLEIIKNAAEILATHFIPLKNKKFSIALTGSLLKEEKLLAKELIKIVKKDYPYIRLIVSETKPVWGAVKIAINNVQ